jgi:hypothetical protein
MTLGVAVAQRHTAADGDSEQKLLAKASEVFWDTRDLAVAAAA